MTNPISIESAKIITLSTAHLHPDTMDTIDKRNGDLKDGPSIAVRDEGYLINSHLGLEDALESDLRPSYMASLLERHPDLVLIRALARGLGADWICVDRDGIEYTDILPSYDGEEVIRPTGDGWKDALGTTGINDTGNLVIMPDRATLEAIEAGQTPGLSDGPQP